MSIEKCSECGKDVSSRANSCPHCGAPREPPKAKPPAMRSSIRILGASILGFLVLAIWLGGRSPTSDTGGVPPPPPSTPASTAYNPPVAPPPATPQVQLPADEVRLISLVESAMQRSQGAANDMQRGGIKHERDIGICATLKSAQVIGWIGTVAKVDSNSDGKGVLSVAIADSVNLETMNNAFSDMSYHTLMDPGTPLFAAASGLHVGQTIQFSGHFFFTHDDDCIDEASLTLNGKLTEPDFIFKFDNIGEPRVTQSGDSRAPVVGGPPDASALVEERSVRASTEKPENEENPDATPVGVPSSAPVTTDQASSPSFSCAGTKSATELLICSDADLAREDRELAALYVQAKAVAADKAAFVRQSVAEWHRRESTCTDKDCLLGWYATRRAELSQIVAAAR